MPLSGLEDLDSFVINKTCPLSKQTCFIETEGVFVANALSLSWVAKTVCTKRPCI